MLGEELNFNDREVVLRADLSTLDELRLRLDADALPDERPAGADGRVSVCCWSTPAAPARAWAGWCR